MTTATQSEFAKLLGKDKSYVTRLKQAGRLVMEGDKVNVEASQARIAATADPSKEHVAERHAANRGDAPRGPTADAVGNSYQQAKAVKEKYLALTAKADYEEKIGKLIERELVDQALADVVAFARQGFENFPHRVAASLVGKDFDQIIAILKQEVQGMIGDMHKEAGKQLADVTKVEA